MIFLSQTADICAGRVNLSTMSDQTRMELLLSDITAKSKAFSQNDEGDYKPVCDWDGVECDDDGNVTAIRWDDMYQDYTYLPNLTGTLHLEFLPEFVLVFLLQNDGTDSVAEGTLNTAKLPVNLDIFTLRGQKFDGSVDLTIFPHKIREIDLAWNKFTGEINLEKLPPQIEAIHLSGNLFHGTVNLMELPAGLRSLELERNKLIGTLNLQALPAGLEILRMDDNVFSGSVDLSNLPRGLRFLNIAANKLSGVVRLDALPEGMEILWMTYNAFEGEVDFATLPKTLKDLGLSNNNFSGTLNFDAMHGEMREVVLDGNPFTATIDTLGKARILYRLEIPEGL